MRSMTTINSIFHDGQFWVAELERRDGAVIEAAAQGFSTRAQDAMKAALEERAQARAQGRSEKNAARAARRFGLRQARRREKRRGH